MSELLVVHATHITEHILDIEFNDGHVSTVDFAPFIFYVGHPDYDAYKNIDCFLNFAIDDGNINWDSYTMIFPIEDLYHNKIIKHR